MKFQAALLLPLALASPVWQPQPRAPTVHMTLTAAAANYTMTFPADGSTHQTPIEKQKDIVNIVDADYDLKLCTFDTPKKTVPAGSSNHIELGPPQPVTAVRCGGSVPPTSPKPGSCVPLWEDCSNRNNGGGQSATCCNGIVCSGGVCRPPLGTSVSAPGPTPTPSPGTSCVPTGGICTSSRNGEKGTCCTGFCWNQRCQK
ncbi:hypothetical protein QBC39DRAFT_415877 [Podospora conica]|nr:hypothetical protein QBC39DRAFT_415877 [Schizothecium conicum]